MNNTLFNKVAKGSLIAVLISQNPSAYCIAKDNKENTSDVSLNFRNTEKANTGIWSENIATLPVIRDEYSSVSIGSKIYFIGGQDPSPKENITPIDIYDTESDTWSKSSDAPCSKNNVTAFAIDDKIYFVGDGWVASNSKPCVDEINHTNTVVYDTISDSWSHGPNKSISRQNSIVAVDKDVYITGGSRNSNFMMYSSETNTWTNKASTAEALSFPALTHLDGKIYMMPKTGPLEVYDITSDTWEIGEPLPKYASSISAQVINDIIYTIIGSDVYAYDPKNGEWTFIESAPFSVGKIVSTHLINGEIYITTPSGVHKYTPTEPEPLKSSSSIDVYIKPQSILSVSLDTNSVTFEDFSNVEDMEKQNAINLNVSSNLPYKINALLASEMQNSDGSEILDKSILSIKANSSPDYKSFPSVNVPVELLDNEVAGDNRIHGIDFKLNKGSYKVDTYKTTVKFEVEQK